MAEEERKPAFPQPPIFSFGSWKARWGAQVPGEQLFGGPLTLSPWFFSSPKPAPSSVEEEPKHLSTLLLASSWKGKFSCTIHHL